MAAVDPMMDKKMQLLKTKTALSSTNMQIVGEENQILQVVLAPQDEIIAEPGCMMTADDQIISEVDHSTFANRCYRDCVVNESSRRIRWQNTGRDYGHITFAPTRGKVVPINLDQHNGEMFINGGSFMATSDPDMDFDIEATGSGAGLARKGAIGGSLYYIKVVGQGWVFLNAAGAIFQRYLQPGETIIADRDHILAWDTTVERGSRRTGGMDMMLCGGEGITNATLTGPGLIIMNSAPGFLTPAPVQ